MRPHPQRVAHQLKGQIRRLSLLLRSMPTLCSTQNPGTRQIRICGYTEACLGHFGRGALGFF